MQPTTTMMMIEVVFIIWFGIQMLVPVLRTTMMKENDND
jgi:hypothetical protein